MKKRGSFDLFISSSIIFPISKYERGNNMTFPKFRKSEDLINRSILFAGVLFAFYSDREKCAFLKILF